MEAPDKSGLFKKYPEIGHHHHAMQFMCDNLRLVLVASVPPHDLDALMDAEIEVHHHMEARPRARCKKWRTPCPGSGLSPRSWGSS